MKKHVVRVLAVLMLLALCAPPIWSQLTGTVQGFAKDEQNNPMVGATIELYSKDTGRKYNLKTNNKGEYFSLGIQPGMYKMSLIQNGQTLFFFDNRRVTLGEPTVVNFEMAKERAAAQARGETTMSPEQKKAMEEQQKEKLKIQNLNEKLAAAAQAQTAGDFNTAINTLREATAVDATKDVLWAKLGDTLRLSAPKQAERAEQTKRYEEAVEAYQKALAIKPQGAYYNNMGDALGRSGKSTDAVKAYNDAAQVDPLNAGQYFFNLGAILTNTGKVDEAIAAFDKAIAADPARADAYYWKGVNLLGKATLKGDKMVAPAGTAEALNKYLELQPEGQFAQPAKELLASIGAPVETTFGKKTPKKK